MTTHDTALAMSKGVLHLTRSVRVAVGKKYMKMEKVLQLILEAGDDPFTGTGLKNKAQKALDYDPLE